MGKWKGVYALPARSWLLKFLPLSLLLLASTCLPSSPSALPHPPCCRLDNLNESLKRCQERLTGTEADNGELCNTINVNRAVGKGRVDGFGCGSRRGKGRLGGGE